MYKFDWFYRENRLDSKFHYLKQSYEKILTIFDVLKY